MPDRINRSRHLALAVDTEEELDHYQQRIEDGGYSCGSASCTS